MKKINFEKNQIPNIYYKYFECYLMFFNQYIIIGRPYFLHHGFFFFFIINNMENSNNFEYSELR